jgi:hypothetical protein
MKNDTFHITTLPDGRETLGTRWVYRLKRLADYSIASYKSRFVIQGNRQIYGIDFSETFAPVVRYASFRIVVAIAGMRGMISEHMDVDTAFLNGICEEDVYIDIPQGMKLDKTGTRLEYSGARTEKVPKRRGRVVLKLNKSLYGLKQAPRAWYLVLHNFLVSLGFIRCPSDWGVYYRIEQGRLSIITIFVDDIVIHCDIQQDMDSLKYSFCKRFNMKALGSLSWCLGIEIKRNLDSKVFYLSQEHYIKKMLNEFKMNDCNTAPTPMDVGTIKELSHPSYSLQTKEDMSQVPYREAIGCLIYLATTTRPDIAQAVGFVSRYVSNPHPIHWTAVKRILRYLKGTSDYALVLGGQKRIDLPTSEKQSQISDSLITGYSDSDWAGDLTTRRSTGGYCFLLGDSCVIWSSKKQRTVALSTTEAEYMAACSATKEAIWLRSLLKDLGFPQKEPTTIFEDNKGCIDIAHSTKHHDRVKHIDIQYHFIREKIESKEIKLVACPTNKMTADVFTKPLPRSLFETHRNSLNVSQNDCIVKGRC